MKNLLTTRQSAVLRGLAAPGTLLAFDYDGTLAPLVSDPARARMRRATRRLLGLLARVRPCAIISGRRREEVLAFLEGVQVAQVVGNHGAEWGEGDAYEAQIARLVTGWLAPLRWSVSRLEGVVLEDKKYSLALHYRNAPDRAKALAHLRRAVADLPAARVVPGILSLAVTPAIAPDKGAALARLLERVGAARAVFVGDDTTDEDAFAMSRRHAVLGVRVGRSGSSAASYYLQSQRLVDELLRRLYAASGEGRGAEGVAA